MKTLREVRKCHISIFAILSTVCILCVHTCNDARWLCNWQLFLSTEFSLVCVYPLSSEEEVLYFEHFTLSNLTPDLMHTESFFGHFSWRSCNPLQLDAGVTDKRSMLLSWFKLRQWGPSEYAPENTCGVIHTPLSNKMEEASEPSEKTRGSRISLDVIGCANVRFFTFILTSVDIQLHACVSKTL